jgi:DNA-binding CsgD family transcriptional regulator
VSLAVLGVDPVAEQIYRLLATRTSATAPEIADELGLPVAGVTGTVEAMAGAGLVAHSPTDIARYIAAPPTVAIGPLLVAQREELRRAEQSLADMAEAYRLAVGNQASRDLLETVTGVEAVRHRFEQVQRGATDEVLAFVTARTVAMSREENEVESAAVNRGVRYRIIMERAVLAQPGALDIAIGAVCGGEEVRVAPVLPMKLLVADRMVGMVPIRGAEEPAAIVVRESGVLDALVALFEMVWAQATPLNAGVVDHTAGHDPVDGKILALLLAGFTDQAVATQLGISMRTVARRIRHLMDLAGVQTRLQLGCHAARAGWV